MMKNIHKFILLLSVLAISSCTDYPDEFGYNIQPTDGNNLLSIRYTGSTTSGTYDVTITNKYNIVEEVTEITSAYIVISEEVHSASSSYFSDVNGTDHKEKAEVTREGNTLTVSGQVLSHLVPSKYYRAYLYLGDSNFTVLMSFSKVFRFDNSSKRIVFYAER